MKNYPTKVQIGNVEMEFTGSQVFIRMDNELLKVQDVDVNDPYSGSRFMDKVYDVANIRGVKKEDIVIIK